MRTPDARHPVRAAVLTVSLLALPACLTQSGGDDDTASAGSVTFHRDVEPLVQQHCQECHRDGGIAPFALVTWEETEPWSGLMASRAEARTMPPWGAQDTAACQPPLPWKHDLRLTDAEIGTLRAWDDAGAPEGDPADAPSPASFSEQVLPGASIEVGPPVSYITSRTRDEFVCFVLDPLLDQDRWLTGAQVLPGNDRVVHHALVYLDTEGESSALAGADGAYPCFGGPGVDGAQLLTGWAPGMAPMELSQDVGFAVPAGSLLVMQLHYHPGGEVAEPDATRVQLALTDTAPTWNGYTLLLGNFDGPYGDGDGLQPGPNDSGPEPEFRIPAGVADHTETMRSTVDPSVDDLTDVRLIGIGAHMHYVGVDMRIWVDRQQVLEGEAESDCLLHTPDWDFNWQRMYYYDVPVAEALDVRGGDRLGLECVYDNTVGNRFVEQALQEQGLAEPVDVFLGEETLDEMCLAVIQVAYRL